MILYLISCRKIPFIGFLQTFYTNYLTQFLSKFRLEIPAKIKNPAGTGTGILS